MKTNLKKILSAVLPAALLCLASCSEEAEHPAPVVTFGNETYRVKVGATITVEPSIENDIDGRYSWTSDGKVLSVEKTLRYTPEESGSVYVTFEVTTDWGGDSTEIRIDAMPLVPPAISLQVPEGGYKVAAGQELELVPYVPGEGNTYLWKVDGENVAATKDYTFISEEMGTFVLSLETSNEDGQDSLEFEVRVVDASEVEFSWMFESDEYNVSVGRRIRLLPYAIGNAFDAVYIWEVDGREMQNGPDPLFVFDAAEEGGYSVTVTMRNSYRSVRQKLTVNVCPPEGTYKRAAGASSSQYLDRVYEFTAAPGQFINENYTASTPVQAAAYAEERLAGEKDISLGAFGGYVVFGFDHSVENDGGYNFQILGNSFANSSEPGIVWVMQDENGDGLPNDTWYELKGSEYGKPETIRDYEITYYRPSGPGMPVRWTDHFGDSGEVDYIGSFHKQDYYYPEWITADSYTLRGTRLRQRTEETSPGYWVNGDFEWGYADNFSAIDRLTDDGNYDASANANHFRISDAVTFDGEPAGLQYVDFVKVQTGVNYKAGGLGEVSTEISGARDYNMIKN